MGGPGSGGWYRYGAKETADGLQSLDINWLNRKGYLVPGWRGFVQWWRGDEHTGSIAIYTPEEGRLVLEYRCRVVGEWESVTDPIWLCHTYCNYGGRRPWFICPACRRRVAKLYAAGLYFRCRHCYALAYDSQREPRRTRLLHKAQNIRRRLGGSVNMLESFPPKPKGMHWETYLRLRLQAEDADLRSWGMLGEWLQALE